jgi:hypothetical protein
LFTRESMLASEWYQRRLSAKQALDVKLTGRGLARLEDFLGQSKNVEVGGRLGLPARLEQARLRLAAQQAPAYLESLLGTLGLDPACFPA